MEEIESSSKQHNILHKILQCKMMVVLLPTVYVYVVAYLIYVYVYLPSEDT
jgi:hypothetical protein